MDFNDATLSIHRQYPGLNTSDLRNMMDDEVRDEQARLKVAHPYNRTSYARAVSTAHDRILNWLATADEYQINDIASFVASHRRACVWSVLVGQRMKEQAALDERCACQWCGKPIEVSEPSTDID